MPIQKLSDPSLSLRTKNNQTCFFLDNFIFYILIYRPSEITHQFNNHNLKIFKNNIDQIRYKCVLLRNNEMIHIIENKINSIFIQMSLLNSIGCWNNEMIEQALNNCGYDFLENSNVDSEKDQILYYIMFGTTYSVNFIFFFFFFFFIKNFCGFSQKMIVISLKIFIILFMLALLIYLAFS